MYVCVYIYIYTYIHRGREKEREREIRVDWACRRGVRGRRRGQRGGRELAMGQLQGRAPGLYCISIVISISSNVIFSIIIIISSSSSSSSWPVHTARF